MGRYADRMRRARLAEQQAGACDLTTQREGGTVPLNPTRPASDAVNSALVASRIPNTSGNLAGAAQGVLVRQARADLTTINASCTGDGVTVLSANEMRCYFVIQNTGLVPIRVAFGTPASATTGLLLNPGAVFEAPVAPTNSVSVFGAVGGTFAIVYANDKRT